MRNFKHSLNYSASFGVPTTNAALAKRFMFSSEEWFPARSTLNYGLYLYLYRAYNPALKRWLTRDPIAEQGGVNLYNFVGNNPVTRWDNWGAIDVNKIILPSINFKIGQLLKLDLSAIDCSSPEYAQKVALAYAMNYTIGGQVSDFGSQILNSAVDALSYLPNPVFSMALPIIKKAYSSYQEHGWKAGLKNGTTALAKSLLSQIATKGVESFSNDALLNTLLANISDIYAEDAVDVMAHNIRANDYLMTLSYHADDIDFGGGMMGSAKITFDQRTLKYSVHLEGKADCNEVKIGLCAKRWRSFIYDVSVSLKEVKEKQGYTITVPANAGIAHDLRAEECC